MSRLTSDALARAFEYPYDVAPTSFMFRIGDNGQPETHPLPSSFSPKPGAVPVLAVGSNRAPLQLARKYADFPPGTEIPLQIGMLGDHDVVFLAAFSGYGAMPAALVPSIGVRVSVHLMWLTAPELERMHATEGPRSYRYEERTNLQLTLEGMPNAPPKIGLYAPRIAPFSHECMFIPIKSILAENRTAEPMAEKAVLDLARQRLAPDLALDEFVACAIENPEQRTDWIRRLQTYEAGQAGRWAG